MKPVTKLVGYFLIVLIAVMSAGTAFALFPPVISPKNAGTSATEDVTYTYNPSATDGDDDPLTWSLSGAPEGMSFDTSSGAISWTPGEGVTTSGELTLTVSDGIDGSDSEIWTITVTPVNDAPVIDSQANSLNTDEDTPLTITLSDLVVTDPDNSYPTGFTLYVQNGTNYNSSGNTITPDENYNGTLTVPVYVDDGETTNSQSNTFNLTVGVAVVNDAPVITGQAGVLNTPEDTPLAITLSDLVVTDPDNSYPGDFTLSVQVGNNYTRSGNTITPKNNFIGDLTVPVIINDGMSDSNTFDLTVTVTGINDAPVITDQVSLTTPEETALTITLNDLLVTDPDNTYPGDFTLSVQDGTNYTQTGNTITPVVDFNGTLTVPVTVDDGEVVNSLSNTFNLTIGVAVVNDAPVIVGQARPLITDEEAPLVLNLSDLNVTDADNAYPFGFTLIVQDGVNYTHSGTTITPVTNFFGNLSVNVQVNDGSGASNALSNVFGLSVTVNPIDDLPAVGNIPNQTVAEGTPQFPPLNLANYLTEVDGDTINWSSSGNIALA
ncbi:MAG: tandem-95 repeat protein, partial [Thermodesulfobacteriota bacterium]